MDDTFACQVFFVAISALLFLFFFIALYELLARRAEKGEFQDALLCCLVFFIWALLTLSDACYLRGNGLGGKAMIIGFFPGLLVGALIVEASKFFCKSYK